MFQSTAHGGQRTQGVTPTSGSTYGNALANPASANTKGAWTELIASTSFDCQGIFVNARAENFTRRYLMDIGVGGSGSETVVIPDLFLWSNNSTPGMGLYFPLRIPAGTRISGRNACSVSGDHVDVFLILVGTDGQWDYAPFLRRATAFGVDAANTRGTTLTAHASGTGFKGAWSQLSAATPHQIDWLVMTIGVDDKASGGTGFLDIGVGAGGSEKVVLPDFGQLALQAPAGDYVAPSEFALPIHIPAGVRLAARWESSVGAETIDVVVIGVGP